MENIKDAIDKTRRWKDGTSSEKNFKNPKRNLQSLVGR